MSEFDIIKQPKPNRGVAVPCVREKKPTQGDLKPRNIKSPIHLLPAVALRSIAKVFGYGAKKYPPGWTWTKATDDWRETYGRAALNHLISWIDQTEPDTDETDELGQEGSHLSHLAMAGTNIMIALWHEARELREANGHPLVRRIGDYPATVEIEEEA